ncbi:membrane protein [Siccirubricoccus deserti]|uniref:DMT family protein n=1 Tax=Siccirubricoccus deserti TaxID=2013562 RepID=A0A9X0UC91_9PROT|nr:DMT family protein [Siccirubricoccus deserti]MBC4014186.1 DMT family protein [Siccirubricoccus deserti]GGC27225.1 membrane protein [Siccirubricoccus deserti]
MTPPYLLPPLLLFGSNILMTWAWYGHLKRPAWPLWLAILISWGIAFFEYCLAVPANRIGYGAYSGQQLKVMQEVITLTVFAGFSVLVLGEPLRWTYLAAMGCLIAAVVFIFLPVD